MAQYGETTTPPALSPGDEGFIVGLLVGEGHFGGDGRQPQVTIRLHTRHEQTLRWLAGALPGSRLYGPYTHGGRSYLQWMSRGAHLRTVVAPLLGRHLHRLDAHVRSRLDAMCAAYAVGLGPGQTSEVMAEQQ